jgi:hypothetical protein
MDTKIARPSGAPRDVLRLRLRAGLWRALIASQELNESALANSLETLIAYANQIEGPLRDAA